MSSKSPNLTSQQAQAAHTPPTISTPDFAGLSLMPTQLVLPKHPPNRPSTGTTSISVASLPGTNTAMSGSLNAMATTARPSSRVGSASSQILNLTGESGWGGSNGSRRFHPDNYDDVRSKTGDSAHGTIPPSSGAHTGVPSPQINARVQRLLDGDLSSDDEPQHLIPSSDPPSPRLPSLDSHRRIQESRPNSGQSPRYSISNLSPDERFPRVPIVTHSTVPTVTPTLSDIASLQRHSQVLRLRNRISKARLHRRLISISLGHRLCEHSGIAYRRLAHFFGREDKRAFAGISAGIVAMKHSWESVMGIGYNHGLGPLGTNRVKTWISEIPSDLQTELVGLINLVRSDPGFLSTCISSLTHPELLALVTSRADTGNQLGGPTGGGSASSQALNNALKSSRMKGGSTAHSGDLLVGENGAVAALDRLVGLGRTETSFTILGTVFGTGEAENRLKLTTWAEVCARLLVAGREGWHVVVSACFEAWAGVELECNMSDGIYGTGKLDKLGKAFGVSLGSGWGARKAVESWLMNLIEQGRFLEFDNLEQPNCERVDSFFDTAITELFDIAGREGGLPSGAVEFGSALLKAVGSLTNSEHKRGEALYQISEWFLRTFLPSVIWNPERAGMLLGVWISKRARTMILRELIARLNRRTLVGKQVPEVRKRVEAMVRRHGGGLREPSPNTTPPSSSQVKPYIVMCPSDVITLINALFPERKTARGISRAGMTMTATSTSDPYGLSGRTNSVSSETVTGAGTPPISVAPRSNSTRSRNLHSSAASVGSIGSTGSGSTNGATSMALSSSALSGSGFLPGAGSALGSGPGLGLGGALGGGLGSAGFRARPVSALVSVAREEAAGVFAKPFDRPERPEKVRDKKDHGSNETARSGTDRNPFFLPGNQQLGSNTPATTTPPPQPTGDLPKPPVTEKPVFPLPSIDMYVRRMQSLIKVISNQAESPPDGCRSFVGPSEKRTSSNLCHPCADTWAVLNVEDGMLVEEDDSDDEEQDEDEYSQADFDELDGNETYDDEVSSTADPELGHEMVGTLPNMPNPSASFPDNVPSDSGTQSPSLGLVHDFDYQFVRSVILELTHSGILSNLSSSANSRRGILAILEQAYKVCVRREEWIPAYRLHQCIIHLRKIAPSSLGRDDYSSLVRMICRGVKETVDDLESGTRILEEWEGWVGEAEKSVRARLDEISRLVGRLRGKLWYTADVQSSAVYEGTKSTIAALKAMGDADVDNDAPADDDSADTKSSNESDKGGTTDIDWTAKLVKSRGLAPEHGFLVQTDSQVVGILVAPSDLGGSRKLSDAQSQLTLDWLKANRIERFCRGEERMFRLGLEISKAVGSLVGDGMLDGPVLWSSELFGWERQKWWEPSSGVGQNNSNPTQLMHGGLNIGGNNTPGGQGGSSAGSNTPIGHGNINSTTIGTPHARGSFFGFKFNQSDVDFVTESPEIRNVVEVARVAEWAPFDNWNMESIEGGTGSVGAGGFRVLNSKDKNALLARLRRQLTGLLISDLGGTLFWDGSELDRWLRSGRVDSVQKQIGVDGTARASLPRRPTDTLHPMNAPDAPSDFPFEAAFKRILARFASDPDPAEKLAALHVLEQVVLAYLVTPSGTTSRARPQTGNQSASPTMGDSSIAPSTLARPAQGVSAGSMPSADLIMDMLQSIFRDTSLTPKTLFRDLQYVALFVPANVLDMGERGKAYWDVSLAALGLKHDVLKAVVTWSSRVINDWVQQHGLGADAREEAQGRAGSATGSTGGPGSGPGLTAPSVPNESTGEIITDEALENAISLLIRAARENHPAAMRELATVYLTLPGIVRPVVSGLSKTGEIIGTELRSSRERQRAPPDAKRPSEKLGVKIGPVHLALARYWMEQGRKGGDLLASNYLHGKEDCYVVE